MGRLAPKKWANAPTAVPLFDYSSDSFSIEQMMFNPTSYALLIAVIAAGATLTILLVIKALLLRRLVIVSEDGQHRLLSYTRTMIQATRLPFIVGVALLAGASLLELTPRQEKWLNYAWILILVSQIALWGQRLITVAVDRAFERERATNPAAATPLMLGGLVARVLLWMIAILITLDNFGFNISALVASLGIGGIAVALAAQNILGDLFASVSIALDKPFVLGDFIIVGEYKGTVEFVGMKTTRLRSLGGEQIIFSNSELLKLRIRNYKRMQERRILFEFGIAYETALEKVEAIPGRVREILTQDGLNVRFDRAHFSSYGDSALNFEVVYYVLSAEYGEYMDIQHAVNLALLRGFRESGIEFAYPTRTLYITAANGMATPANGLPVTRT
jgi:small-conductance mechanosensitive channel